MIAADTNILIHAANARSPSCEKARRFLAEQADNPDFALCELNLIELYMALRNAAIFEKPLTAMAAADYCHSLRSNLNWQILDYTREVTPTLWTWARSSQSGFRRIIDARIALTLLHHGVQEFATANLKDFTEFGFRRLWDPLA